MKITESATSTFWKGEQGIRASVQDGDTLYKVSLYVKGSQVRDYSCSCVMEIPTWACAPMQSLCGNNGKKNRSSIPAALSLHHRRSAP